MTTVVAVMDAIDAKLDTITGLRVASYKASNVTPPLAYTVAPDIPSYNDTFEGGYTLAFKVVLLVSPTDVRLAERQIAQFTDHGSIPQAFDADQTLGGIVANVDVVSFTRFDSLIADTIGYPGGEFHLSVMF